MSPLLVLLLATPADISADELEIAGSAWRATGEVRAAGPGWTLSAPVAHGEATATCPEGRVQVEGPARLSVYPDLRLRAASLDLCLPARAVESRGVEVVGPRLRLTAAQARFEGRRWSADDVTATTCACEDPPWHVTATAARGVAGEGAWASWPVLWTGGVPVLAAPAWYVPLSRRRTGFLLPEPGFDGEDGPYGRLPFFWALHPSADLTLSPGWRATHGPTAGARLRWAADDDESGIVEGETLVGAGTVARGDGSLPLGPARLALAGEMATDARARAAVRPGLAARGRDHLRTRAATTIAGARMALGASATWLQDLRPPAGDDLVGQAGVPWPAPEVWLLWSAPVPLGEVRVGGRFVRLEDAGGPETQGLALDAGLHAAPWLGPLRLRPELVLQTRRTDGEAGEGARFVAAAAVDASAAVARTAADLRHEVRLSARARAAEAQAVGVPPEPLPEDSRRAELALSTGLTRGETLLSAEIAQGHEAADPVPGLEPLALRLLAEAPVAGAQVLIVGDEAVRLRARAGAPGGHRVEVGYTRLRLDGQTPHFAREVDWAGRLRPDAPDLDVAEGRLTAVLGRLEASWGVVVDARDPAILGQEGGLLWRGRCDCWSVRLHGSHERGRSAPDAWLQVALDAP